MICSKKQPRLVPRSRLTLTAILKLVSETADGMLAVDPNGKILAWNPSAGQILGYRAEEVIGKPCYEILSARDPSGNLFCFEGCAVMTMAKENHLIRNYNTQMKTKNNRTVWLNTSILLVSDERWPSPLIIHLFRPITPPHARGSPAKGIDFKPTSPLPSLALPPPMEQLPLTPREREVLTLLSLSLVAKEIASKLHISVHTARTHIQSILEKLHAHSKLGAVMIAMKQGLL